MKIPKFSPNLLKSPAALVIVLILALASYYFSGGNAHILLSGGRISPAAQVRLQDDELALFFLDVGQGDCILVEKGDQAMLVDTGSGDAVMAVLNFLSARQVPDIDILVLTHGHEDHIGNAGEVLRRYDVGTVYLPEQAADSAVYRDLLVLIDKYDVPQVEAWAGDSFPFAGADCQIISPSQDYGPEDLNNSSLVLLLTYGETRFLLTGDAETRAERDILDQGWDIDADLLKIGHHGSASSTGAAFLAAVSPEIALISLAGDNEYGFPHQEVMRTLNAANLILYRTDLHGSVAAVSNGQAIAIVTDR